MDFFKLKENNTTVRTEVFAGITTFMTMAYILIVNPNIMQNAGMSRESVFTATALAAFIGTMAMALLANYPFALAPCMGLNAYFAFTVASENGWEIALIAVFIEGLIFILFSIVNVREIIFNSIPKTLKQATSVGIGFFIAFIGLQNAGIVVFIESTCVSLGDISNIGTILAFFGLILTAYLSYKKVKGALFWGIFVTYLLGIACELIGLYIPEPENGVYSLIPEGIVSFPHSVSGYNIFSAFKNVDFSVIGVFDIAVVVFSFLFVDMFDTIGTLVGVSEKAGYLDKEGKLPKLKNALLADAIATTFGACVGTSTTSTFVESASGVAEGGRTGLTSIVTAGLFLIALFFSPVFTSIPTFATAPALIIVGLFMIDGIVNIDFKDYTEGFPAFVTIIMMPLAYSIADGLAFGFLSYIILKVLTGKTKDVSIIMYIIGVIFLIKFIVQF